MKTRMDDETKLLINYSETIIQIDDKKENPKSFDKDMPQDVMNEIAKRLPSKKYSSLARLSQTSTIMKKLVENTESGKKAQRAKEIKPSELALQVEPGKISFWFNSLFCLSCLAVFCAVGIAREVGALPHETGNPVLNDFLDYPIISIPLMFVFFGSVFCCTYTGLDFFSTAVKNKNSEAEQLRAEIDEQYGSRIITSISNTV